MSPEAASGDEERDLYPTRTRMILLCMIANGQVLYSLDPEDLTEDAWAYPDAPTSWADPVKVTARIEEMRRAGWVTTERADGLVEPTDAGAAVWAENRERYGLKLGNC